MTSPNLPVDALEALANAHLLSVMPGTITSIEATITQIVVRSSLNSPFPDKTPSLWEARFSRTDGSTIALDVLQTSQPR